MESAAPDEDPVIWELVFKYRVPAEEALMVVKSRERAADSWFRKAYTSNPDGRPATIGEVEEAIILRDPEHPVQMMEQLMNRTETRQRYLDDPGAFFLRAHRILASQRVGKKYWESTPGWELDCLLDWHRSYIPGLAPPLCLWSDNAFVKFYGLSISEEAVAKALSRRHLKRPLHPRFGVKRIAKTGDISDWKWIERRGGRFPDKFNSNPVRID